MSLQREAAEDFLWQTQHLPLAVSDQTLAQQIAREKISAAKKRRSEPTKHYLRVILQWLAGTEDAKIAR
jgi:hypothetical protein